MFEDSELIDHIGQAQALVIDGDRSGAQTLLACLWAHAIQLDDHYRACVSAHFLAHAHTEPALQRDWHLRALDAADAVSDARVHGFYPSLYANIAEVSLRLGDFSQSRTYVGRAQDVAHLLPDDSYGRMIHSLIARIAAELAHAEVDR
jgi:hypothetical protein